MLNKINAVKIFQFLRNLRKSADNFCQVFEITSAAKIFQCCGKLRKSAENFCQVIVFIGVKSFHSLTYSLTPLGGKGSINVRALRWSSARSLKNGGRG